MGDRYDPKYCLSYDDGSHEYLTLNKEEKSKLINFIILNCKKIKSINMKHTSYGLKHMFENAMGFYVSNSDTKKLMTECGFKHQEWPHDPNWCFNISEKSIKGICDLNWKKNRNHWHVEGDLTNSHIKEG